LPVPSVWVDAPGMTGDTALLDPVARDADRVVLCRCGGFGRVTHVAVNGPGEPERYVRSTFTCTWERPARTSPCSPREACDASGVSGARGRALLPGDPVSPLSQGLPIGVT
jgi:hypothetical protein